MNDSEYRATESRHKQTPRGYGPPGRTSSTFSLLEWPRQPKVEEAWRALTQNNGLVLDPFSEEKRTQVFGISDSAVIGDWPLPLSMRKARNLGFLGTADSYESAFKTIHDLARLKLVAPPVMKDFVEQLFWNKYLRRSLRIR